MYLNDEDTWAEKEFGGLRTSLHRKKNRTIAEFQCFSAFFNDKGALRYLNARSI